MISDSTPTYCLEEMWAAKACYPECNTYQCGHRHCTTAQAIAKCAIEQGALSATMLTTPNEFDLATNVTSTASDTSTLVPMDVQLGISGISLSIDAVANQMQMKLSYTLSLKWRDSRLDTAPCATMMQTAMTYKAGASTADVDRAGTMSALLWFPHISFLNSAGSQGTIQTESSTFALEAESPWSAGSPSDGSASCAECATYTTTGSVSMYLAPTWKYAQFPFDTHEIVYEVRVSDAELFNCKEMFTGMALSTEELRTSTLLPATQEWGFLEDGQRSMRLEFGRGARGVGEDRSVCVVRIEVRRNSVVFAIKQLAVTVIVVVCGLCALFLHAADHTGDRTALVLLAALICATSFQTDLGLGSIHYILWFDVWNVCNIALLLVCLVLCLYEHQLFMTDREKEATILNGITRWLLPFAYYPTVVIALFWHGWYPTSAAPWIVLVIGFAGISVFFRLKLRHAHATSDKRQREVIAALSEAQLASDDFVRLLNDAFAAFDADRSGDIDLDELRTVLKAIFPAASHQEFAGLMLQVREFCAGSNALDCNAFVDAVMHLPNLLTCDLSSCVPSPRVTSPRVTSPRVVRLCRSCTSPRYTRRASRSSRTATMTPTSRRSSAWASRCLRPRARTRRRRWARTRASLSTQQPIGSTRCASGRSASKRRPTRRRVWSTRGRSRAGGRAATSSTCAAAAYV